jgi:uncharacterized membrane protein (DUF106 family)
MFSFITKTNIKFVLAMALIASLVAGYISFKNSVYNDAEQEVIEEVLTKEKENYIETRKRIDEAISPNRTVESALERLRERQARRVEGE